MHPGLIQLKKIPFVRLLLFLVAGIVAQWYLQFDTAILFWALAFIALALVVLAIFSLSKKFILRWLQGVLILFVMFISGAILTNYKNITHKKDWYGNSYTGGDEMLVTIQEPLVTKTNSYKAQATVAAVKTNGKWQPTQGDILVYFKKDSSLPAIEYGTQIVINKALQPIANSGNIGAFDYQRYCLFHGITGQVFLKEREYAILPEKHTSWLQQTLFNLRNATINNLQKYIPGEDEQGVAEALLIGYREDLDKDLVQAYSNTGVVHIIAISGLHLGMIYAAMVWLFGFFKRYKLIRFIQPLTILFVLWAFTLIAGAVPSIMRSAVMFTFIIIGQVIDKRSSMYNTLAASAFCMLVYDPFMLWDVGFLLSFAAVISIITFMRPIYGLLYYRNKSLDKLWSLMSVTLSAQVLTIPIVVFYFHQFPNFFLITNFIVVPLSGLILYGEILLLLFSFFPPVANAIGWLLHYMLYGMNAYIQNINALPVAVWNNLQLSTGETWLLFGIFVSVALWLMYKSSKAFIAALAFCGVFSLLLCMDYIQRNQQHKLIVYNVPKYEAIDIVEGNHYAFIGDSTLTTDGFLRNFHLKPARVLLRANDAVPAALKANNITSIDGKNILLLTQPLPANYSGPKVPVDVLIVSQNPRLYINQLSGIFDCKEIVFDSSNPLWKIQLWKKDCENLHLRFHCVATDGAFVMDL